MTTKKELSKIKLTGKGWSGSIICYVSEKNNNLIINIPYHTNGSLTKEDLIEGLQIRKYSE